MTTSSKPTILFVHGSWHNPAHFGPVRAIFEVAGFPTECPAQPSYNASPEEMPDPLAKDVEAVTNALAALIDQGREVLVVLHSYGGVVGTQAVHERFGVAHRRWNGLRGGVTQLLYMAAFVLPEGESLVSALGGQLPPFIEVKVGT